jgi:AAA domain
MPDHALQRRADQVLRAVVDHVVRGQATSTLVDSGPGAGKTQLVKRTAAAALEEGQSLLVAVQTNAQAVDLVGGLADLLEQEGLGRRFGFWPSQSAARGEWSQQIQALASRPSVVLLGCTADVNDGPDVVVAVASKWGWHCCQRKAGQVLTRSFELGVVDEAYQMQAGQLVRFGGTVERLLQVGDPGQLEPFTTVDDSRWVGQETSALTPAPQAVESFLGGRTDTFALPASLRLDARAAPVVQRCFYPRLPFRAVAQPGDRALQLQRPARRSRDPHTRAADAALDQAARAGWSQLQLPPRLTVPDDPDVARALALLARRALERQATVRASFPPSLRHGAPLSPDQIAIATAHRNQRDRVRELLDQDPRTQGVIVDTCNRLQGREVDLVLVWSPLSGRVDAGAFHLDQGRLAVACSRQRQACVLVSRAGVQELLDDHLPSGQRPQGAHQDREHDGWLAHRRLLEHLDSLTVEAPDLAYP